MTSFPTSSKSSTGVSIGGKLGLTLFFLVFFGMGALFVWLVAREAVAGLQTWTWSRTVCEITRSRVRETDQGGRNNGDFYVDVEYRYRFRGQPFTSDRHQLKPTGFSDYGKVDRLTQQFRPGSNSVCYVNPAAPGVAVLQRGSLVFPLLVLFPLIFVAIGAIGIYSAWRPAAASRAIAQPISDRATRSFGFGFVVLFFGIFIAVGGLLFYFLSVRPLSEILAARRWPAVPCTVVASSVKSHRGDHGSTYSVNILYSYVFNDREFKANRYDFMGGSSSGYEGKQAIVSRYPPGSKAFCFVNPSDPAEAVLERGFTPIMWIGFLPLVFVLLGMIGLLSNVRKRRAQSVFAAARIESIGPAVSVIPPSAASTSAGFLVLKPRSSPTGKLLGTVAIALFWNGGISLFLAQVIKGWHSGHLEWFLALFLIPFVLVGLGLIAAVFYFFLALFNPRPHLTLTPGEVVLGGTLRVEWEVAGRIEALRNLRLRLQGREEATYTRGTKTTTDRSVFADLDIATVTALQEMRSGSGAVTIPPTLMHSFMSKHNKLLWSIQVQGEIARWPDVNEEFPVTVLPARL